MYHLPLFFITVKGTTAAEAGAHLMPTSFGQVIGSAVGGFVSLLHATTFHFADKRSQVLNRTGRYWRLSLLVGILPVCAMAILGRMDARTSEFVSWVCVVSKLSTRFLGEADVMALVTSSVRIRLYLEHLLRGAHAGTS
jgi:hypothetical protein